MTTVDWKRVAEPQADGYDSQVILKQSQSGRYAIRKSQPTGPLVWPDGRARWITVVETRMMPSTEYGVLPLDDSIISDGLKILDLWPEVRLQCATILEALCPMTSAHRAGSRGQGHGCSCGHFGDDFGWIYVTADDSWGFAEGIVHEMGHWKLRALGMWFEDWTPFILDHGFDELYASPVRKDKPRPMGAVLHAQYSYIHVARMSSLALKATSQPTMQDVEWAELQLSRITEGQGTLRDNARGTKGVGDAFLAGVDAWTTRVLTEGHEIVAAAKAGIA